MGIYEPFLKGQSLPPFTMFFCCFCQILHPCPSYQAYRSTQHQRSLDEGLSQQNNQLPLGIKNKKKYSLKTAKL